MTSTTGIRSGSSEGMTVVFRCEDHLARFWTMRIFRERSEITGYQETPYEIGCRNLTEEGAIGETMNATEILIPSPVMAALADAFGDPDYHFQRQVKNLEAELGRAHEIIKALAGAVGPAVAAP